jgi:hypothetical protein
LQKLAISGIIPQDLLLILLASLLFSLPYGVMSKPSFNIFLTWKTMFFAIAEVLANLCMVLTHTELGVMTQLQAISLETGGRPIPATTFTPSLGLPPSRFCSSCPS